MPTNSRQRWRAKHGDFAVPCIVSGRWLEFSQDGSGWSNEGEALTVTVMTENSEDQQRKLCELIETREELLRVLTLIEKPTG